MVNSQANSAGSPQGDLSNEDEILRLFVQYQRVLFAYLRTALGSTADAEEALQETSISLWRNRHDFVMGTNFVNWAMTIARNQVYRIRRNRKHKPQIVDDELLDQMATAMAARYDLIDARYRALEQCLQALSERDRCLISAAYSAEATKKSVGQSLGMTPNGIYKALNRLRQRLLKCIQRRLMMEGM